jgi:hypothetical protein
MTNQITTPKFSTGLLVTQGTPLYDALLDLAQHAHLVFFAGLPGTGKSLLINQLAHLAHHLGRTTTLLQWDVARPVFEACEAGRRYPQAQGITHSLIRMAVGRWARGAVTQWHTTHPDMRHLLIGETPFVGNRFSELARPNDDDAEAVLTHETTRFVIPVPSLAVRHHLEAERERRAQNPLHQREREDAPPAALREMWRLLVVAAQALGITPVSSNTTIPYDPHIYERMYHHILQHRHTQTIAQDTILPTDQFSAYDFAVSSADLVPTDDEANELIHIMEKIYLNDADLEREVARWYVI